MFCRECGIRIPEDSNFCAQCGTAVQDQGQSPQASERQDNKPVLTLKPVFISWVTILSVAPFALFVAAWVGIFTTGLGLSVLKGSGIGWPVWYVVGFAEVLLCVGVPTLIYVARKRTYAQTEYKFYPDRFEYAEGFWTAENKTINYKNITEANLKRGVIQRKYGLGTIYLATPATGLQQGRAASGIRIADIPNSDEVYDTIRELINSRQ